VTFEIARRHRFATDLARLPDGVTVHVLPSGEQSSAREQLRYRDTRRAARRVDTAYAASVDYLAAL